MEEYRSHLILMADMIDSRNQDQGIAMEYFNSIIKFVNSKHYEGILSPLTITLGDEFQGIVRNIKSAIDILFEIEESLIHSGAKFKLRYVLVEGKIDTPINREIAYGMMGDGLTTAREQLAKLKHGKSRFNFFLKRIYKSKVIYEAFFIYQSFIDSWDIEKDYPLVSEFLLVKDYKIVAKELDKTRSQIWKREKNLKIDEYFSVKLVISYLTRF